MRYLLMSLTPLAILIFSIWITWGGFLMMMPLKRKYQEGGLNLAAKIFGYPWLAIFILLDFTFNVTIGSIIFLDIPREWLFTKRLDRYLGQDDTYWRHRLAKYFCHTFLDPFDPDGHHCDAKDV